MLRIAQLHRENYILSVHNTALQKLMFIAVKKSYIYTVFVLLYKQHNLSKIELYTVTKFMFKKQIKYVYHVLTKYYNVRKSKSTKFPRESKKINTHFHTAILHINIYFINCIILYIRDAYKQEKRICRDLIHL